MTEAQDHLRQERAKHYAKKYGPYVAIFITLILISVGGKQAWHAYTHHNNTKNTVLLLNSTDSLEGLSSMVQDNTSAQGAMAGLIAFSRMDSDAKATQGLTLLNDISSNDNYPKLWRDYTSLVFVRSSLAFQGDAANGDALLEKLKPLMSKSDDAFYAASRIETASILAVLKQNKAEALAMLDDIKVDTLPAHLRQKRDDLITYLTFLQDEAPK